MVIGCEHALRRRFVDPFYCSETLPQGIRRREIFKIVILASQKIVLDDAPTICGIRELEPKNERILLGLLQAITGVCIDSLRFHHRYRKITAIAKQIISPFLRLALNLRADHDNASISETSLLTDLLVCPAGSVQLRQNIT